MTKLINTFKTKLIGLGVMWTLLKIRFLQSSAVGAFVYIWELDRINKFIIVYTWGMSGYLVLAGRGAEVIPLLGFVFILLSAIYYQDKYEKVVEGIHQGMSLNKPTPELLRGQWDVYRETPSNVGTGIEKKANIPEGYTGVRVVDKT